MTSDIERPRQRTVAELLAEHGESGASSRRRRRRAPEDEPGEAPDVPSPPPIAEQRTSATAYSGAFTAEDNDRREAYREVSRPARDERQPPMGGEDRGQAGGQRPGGGGDRFPAGRQRAVPGAPGWGALPPPPAREFPTDVMPRVPAVPAGLDTGYAPARDERGVDEAVTGPIPIVAPPGNPRDTGPIAPGAPGSAGSDDGPPTQYSPGVVGDEDDPQAADDEWADNEWSDDEWADDESAEDDDSADDVTYAEDDGDYDEDDDDREPLAQPDPDRTEGRAGAPTWPAVIAQWIAGAIGGAALWVGFRFLWKGFPVVAVAAALVVTIGLVVIVRALLRNRDLRTTIFAVLVGLLLTASPAILVLIGR